MDFYDLDLCDEVLDALDDMNFTQCTPIQEKAIPAILDGKDVIAVAQTGTGKTAAFLLPILSRLCDYPHPEHAINCVVMSPTRELAQQIDQALEGFSYYVPVSSVAVYGGNDGIRFEQEKRGMSMGTNIVIATPGRLISHLSLGNCDLSQVSYFILDEADRMLDMGFSEDIMQIVKHLPEKRQTILFSATMPDKIQKLAKNILKDPVEIKIAVSKPAEKIDQSVVYCYETQKLEVLKWYFKNNQPKRVIIFASSKLKVKEINRALKKNGFISGEMHSDLEQAERDEVMYDFKIQKLDILVATDIVARGIDIDDIQLVINYDVPHDAEDYVHRIGRTARANNSGKAFTLVSEKEQYKFKEIEKFLEIQVPVMQTPENIEKPPVAEKKNDSSPNGKKRRKKRTSPKKKTGASADQEKNVSGKQVKTKSKPSGEKQSEDGQTTADTSHKKRRRWHRKTKNKKDAASENTPKKELKQEAE